MQSRTEKLFFRHILEGLIHNLNTPLNLIMGYGQQLQKLHPEMEGLNKIVKASIEMDDFLKHTYKAFLDRFEPCAEEIDLYEFLASELKYFTNDLYIKHRCRFELVAPEHSLLVKTSRLALSYSLENLISGIIEQVSQASLSMQFSFEEEADSACIKLIMDISMPKEDAQGLIAKSRISSLYSQFSSGDCEPECIVVSDKEFCIKMRKTTCL